MSQRGRCVIAGQCQVALHEELTEVASAEELEIHREERRIIDDVDVAQPIIELQTVQQRRAVR